MDAYTGFAEVYDLFMDNVPYEEWSGRICGIFRQYGIDGGLVLELGCGTGKLTRLLAAAGYDMIGLDNSEEMLAIAREHGVEAEDAENAEPESEDAGSTGLGSGILYLLQDMREFELYGTVRGICSVCDCMNYLLSEEDLLTVFRLASNYLDPGGIFLFDMNTSYKYEQILKDATFAENRDEGSFIWENSYDAESGINEYDLTLFIREDETHFCRCRETHYQRSYPAETVRRLLEEAGFEFLAAYDGYSGEPLRENSERMLIAARENRKE